MDLWIRSQDRMNLVKVNQINVNYQNNKQIIANYIPDFVGTQGEYYEMLGSYKTKERALEVLDEIQNLLIPKTIVNTFNIEKKDMLNGNQYSIFENNIKDFSIEQFDTYVYEMPKE